MKKVAIVLIIGLIALALIIPASSAYRGGDGTGCGKMVQQGNCQLLNGTSCQNFNCTGEDCSKNMTFPRDGTGFQHGLKGCGKQT